MRSARRAVEVGEATATVGRMASAGAATNRASAARRDLWPSGIAPPSAESVVFGMGCSLSGFLFTTVSLTYTLLAVKLFYIRDVHNDCRRRKSRIPSGYDNRWPDSRCEGADRLEAVGLGLSLRRVGNLNQEH